MGVFLLPSPRLRGEGQLPRLLPRQPAHHRGTRHQAQFAESLTTGRRLQHPLRLQDGRSAISRGACFNLPEDLFPGNAFMSGALQVVQSPIQLLPVRVRERHSSWSFAEALPHFRDQIQPFLSTQVIDVQSRLTHRASMPPLQGESRGNPLFPSPRKPPSACRLGSTGWPRPWASHRPCAPANPKQSSLSLFSPPFHAAATLNPYHHSEPFASVVLSEAKHLVKTPSPACGERVG